MAASGASLQMSCAGSAEVASPLELRTCHAYGRTGRQARALRQTWDPQSAEESRKPDSRGDSYAGHGAPDDAPRRSHCHERRHAWPSRRHAMQAAESRRTAGSLLRVPATGGVTGFARCPGGDGIHRDGSS